MKKTFTSLALGACVIAGFTATAQQRMTLHEEFTGENCPPCASTNPGFWTLLNGGTNPSKIIHIAYMSPIPSSGWFYMQTQAMSDNRITYYSVPFAPYGRYDGAVPDPGCSGGSSAGHPGCFTQADIDAEYAIASPFNITCTNAWNATYDSVVTTVTITCVSSTGWTAATPYLRAALVQNVDFPTPPGTNGETHFENVVRAMYPSALGTSLPTSWTNGESHSYTITGAVPSFVAKDGAPFMVVWVQNDGDKSIAQAAKGTPLPPVPNDATITAISNPGLTCQPDGSYTPAHTVTLKNVGNNNITSATIYYQVDGGAWASTPWSGSIAPGATTDVVMPATALTVAGPAFHSFYDSVANVNSGDQNIVNNTKGVGFFIENATQLSMPYTTSFESVDLGKFYGTDANNNQETWGRYAPSSSSPGHTGAAAMFFNCYAYADGESEVLTLPEVTTTNPSVIEFWEAYAQYDNTTNDKLEVVYSSDCGNTWTSIWSQAGATLSTSAATTSQFIPTAAKYKHKTADISSVPANSIIGFRGTSNFGNIIWIDDINIRAGVDAVNNVATLVGDIAITPNPATANASFNFNLKQATNVSVEVYDAVGRMVYSVAAEQMSTGAHSINIPVTSLSNGIYNVVMTTDNGKATERLTVAK